MRKQNVAYGYNLLYFYVIITDNALDGTAGGSVDPETVENLAWLPLVSIFPMFVYRDVILLYNLILFINSV